MAELPEIRLAVATAADAGSVGTKLGGRPEWIQTEWEPQCCGQPMTFLAQVDTLDLPNTRFPDSALVYVFYCSKCFEVASQLQCC